MSSPPGHWLSVKHLFDLALERSRGMREAVLAAADVDEAVRAEVRSLLAHHDEATGPASFLSEPAATQTFGPASRDGQRLGAWQVERLLGSGGMGDVFEARRADGSFEGRAAIKLLKRGMDSVAVLQRFAQERQTLARLNHPNIARLFDAGVSDDGLPYFVMELVDGRPIDLATQALPVDVRLALFLQLADAVAHAHHNLLVHRDLKPGNVLVTPGAQVKLLDFGIAKALDPLDPAGAADPDLTLAGQRPYTPSWASPEQVRGEPVSTATDIYSMGVLLYVMLTGQRPYGRSASTPQELARAVLEEEPTRPSALSPGPLADAQWLRTRRRLEGDLDNILLKALDKQVPQRYATVEALAADIRAHQAGQPVSACAPRLGYLAAKFVRRHRVAVLSAALAGLALVAGLAVTLAQMREAERARQVAEHRFKQVRQLANGMVFKYHDQIVNQPGTIAVRAALLDDAVGYLDSLALEGEMEPALARESAETYFRIAVLQGERNSPSQERLADAERNLDKALALLPRYVDAPAVDIAALNSAADMWLARANQHGRRARLALNQAALEQAHRLTERARQQAPDDAQVISRLATLEGQLGLLLGGSAQTATRGRPDEAAPHMARAVALFEQLVQREPGNAEWVHQLAWGCHLSTAVQLLRGDAARAVAWGERTTALRDQAAHMRPGDAHLRFQTASARLLLAQALAAAGQHERGFLLQEESLAIMQAVASADLDNKAAARDVGLTRQLRVRTLLLAGRDAEARAGLVPLLAEGPDDHAALAADFTQARQRAEVLLLAARAWSGTDAPLALGYARRSQALMQAPDREGENAARRWMLAQALGEEAAVLAAQGSKAEAARAAQRALALWREGTPQGVPPGFFMRWFVRDTALAQPAG